MCYLVVVSDAPNDHPMPSNYSTGTDVRGKSEASLLYAYRNALSYIHMYYSPTYM
jgi:hypothetical protein